MHIKCLRACVLCFRYYTNLTTACRFMLKLKNLNDKKPILPSAIPFIATIGNVTIKSNFFSPLFVWFSNIIPV